MSDIAVTKDWKKRNFLTVGKLVAWLQKQSQDALVYAVEPNTGTWQEIPDDCFERVQYFATVEDEKKKELESFSNWHKHSDDPVAKAQEDVDRYFQYVDDEDGVCILG